MLAALLAGCSGHGGTPSPSASISPGAAIDRQGGHVPEFAIRPYMPFSRADAVAIASREWRLFGQPIDDDPPDTRPPLPPELKPERMAGLWERVGEYWWISQDPDRSEGSWTGKHDAGGSEFSASEDYNYAWSAAFVSYVMRIAGAGTRFPYSPSHYTYINLAREMSLNQTTGWAITAERIDTYPPQPGDIICSTRDGSRRVRFDDLPTHRGFPAHCAIVVAASSGEISIIGGNVDDAVTLTHVPTTPDGRLALAGDVPVDTRYPWFVVLRVLYDN